MRARLKRSNNRSYWANFINFRGRFNRLDKCYVRKFRFISMLRMHLCRVIQIVIIKLRRRQILRRWLKIMLFRVRVLASLVIAACVSLSRRELQIASAHNSRHILYKKFSNAIKPLPAVRFNNSLSVEHCNTHRIVKCISKKFSGWEFRSYIPWVSELFISQLFPNSLLLSRI